jgi:hypothetical protein
MTRPERMIIVLVALVILTRIAGLGEDILMASLYGPSGPSYLDKQYWIFGRFLISSLVNVGAATWIFLEARAAALRSWIWALLGLFFGLVGVAIYFVAQIYAFRRDAPTKGVNT